MKKLRYDGPIVLAVLDGVGLKFSRSGNAVRQAHIEFLDNAMVNYLNVPLHASGEYVGIMKGQMGNSEVGHNALGSGQIIKQGIAQVEADFLSGLVWQSKVWQTAIKTKGTLHFAGIFSDGGVHSDIKHLEMMIEKAVESGVKNIRLHAVFDGRDVAPQSEPKFIERFEKFAAKFKDADIKIADGGGRMVITADRYESDWGMVRAGYDLMTTGKIDIRLAEKMGLKLEKTRDGKILNGAREFTSATEAIKTLRRENPKVQDQYLPPFVIVEPDKSKIDKSSVKISHAPRKPIGIVKDGDSLIYFDFRADRAVEIAEAFDSPSFDKFKRNKTPKIYFAGLTEYNADKHIPKNILVAPIKIQNTLNQFLGRNKISQFAISETVKFGHITYYFNGNSYKKAAGEKHLEIESYNRPFNECPWMKTAEIADEVIKSLNKYKFIRINFPGGDMVGHFGEMESTIIALETIDLHLQRIAKEVDKLGGMLIITADHGNAEELLDKDGGPKTSHTTNQVPCIFYDNTKNAKKYQIARSQKSYRTSQNLRRILPDVEVKVDYEKRNFGIANIAATVAILLGQEPPAGWEDSIIEVK